MNYLQSGKIRHMKNIIFAVTLLLVTGAGVKAEVLFAPITSGYGANGSYAIQADKFPSPRYDRENVYVFRPQGIDRPVPVIFFAPGYNNNDPREYRALIDHIVSRGYALVYAPFQILSGDITLHEKRYDTIWAGFEEAVDRYGESFDLDRVGYAGHSYGGAAVLAMALRGVERRGWGSKGLLLYALAPWYYYQVSLRDFVNFPSHAKLVVQVYENDGVCDHRMGREMFDRVNLPSSEKDFLMLRSQERMGYRLDAAHGTPSDGTDENALDYFGVYRIFDALAEYAFNGDERGKQIALGNGGAEQRFMGLWPDGQPVREMLAGDCVPVTRSSLSFLFPYLGGGTKGLTNVSSGSLKPVPIAPDSLVSAWGTNFSLYPMSSGGGPALELNGTIVKVRDGVCEERLAPLFFVSPTQVNYLVPAGTISGSGAVTIFNSAGAIATTGVAIENVSPGLFSANADGVGPAAMSVLRVRADGSQSYERAIQFEFARDAYVASPIDLTATNEDVYLLLFGTGLRFRSSLSNVRVTIGGVPVEVLYAGAQGLFPGLDQINLRVPKSLAGRGLVDIVLQADGRSTNIVQANFR